MCKFLIVEDDPKIRAILKKFVEELGHSVSETDCEEDARHRIATNGIECMFLDLELKEGTGYGVLDFLHEIGRFIPHVVMSGDEFNKPEWAEEHGFLSFEQKPFSLSRIKELIQKANKMNDDFNRISIATEKIHIQAETMSQGLKDLGLTGE